MSDTCAEQEYPQDGGRLKKADGLYSIEIVGLTQLLDSFCGVFNIQINFQENTKWFMLPCLLTKKKIVEKFPSGVTYH